MFDWLEKESPITSPAKTNITQNAGKHQDQNFLIVNDRILCRNLSSEINIFAENEQIFFVSFYDLSHFV